MKAMIKLGLTLATVGGAFMMAAPAAFADDTAAFQGLGAGSFQTQDGSGSGDAILNQNSNIQIGQLQANDYYNNTNTFGFNSSSNSYTTTDGVSGTGTSTADQNYGGNSVTKAENYAQQQAQLTQSQSQIIGNWYSSNWNDNSSDESGSTQSGGTGGEQYQGGGVISLQDASGLLGYVFGMNTFNPE
jgi:hypothetical protein